MGTSVERIRFERQTMAESNAPSFGPKLLSSTQSALSLALEVVQNFHLTDLQTLLEAAEKQAHRTELNLAVFGRFKAGKSSFLNHLLQREVLPVGVVPLTSVVTQICHGNREMALVYRIGERDAENIPIGEISAYITEARNPANAKRVSLLQIYLPELENLPDLQLVDTPGLDSLLQHNTEAATAWSPNVDLAVVATSVDPPLSKQDIELIERLMRFTPKICVLLTKVDQLEDRERDEVLEYVSSELRCRFESQVRVFPYSIRAGFEALRNHFEMEYLRPVIAAGGKNRCGLMQRKLQELLQSASEYLQIALRIAEKTEAEQEALRKEIRALEESLADRKLQIRLAVQYGIGHCRKWIENHLQRAVSNALQNGLEEQFEQQFGDWQGSFAKMLAQFEYWLAENLQRELSRVSLEERRAFLEPLQTIRRQLKQQLQNVREKFSEKFFYLTGVALVTAQVEIVIAPPTSPDISIGKIFDRNWELLSFVIPMWIARGMMRKRFVRKIESETYKNLSRLTSQWEEALASSMRAAGIEAERQLDEYVATIRRMTGANSTAKQELLASTLRRIEAALASITEVESAEDKTSLPARGDSAE
jgi:GTP-binding protein EngB required for normal cell division